MTVTDPVQPQPDRVILSFTPTSLAIADCACAIHAEDHTSPGSCPHRAAYKLLGVSLMNARPIVALELCAECLQYHHAYFSKTFPTVHFEIVPL